MKKKLSELYKWGNKHEWVIFLMLAVIILRLPSFFMPHNYGDEEIYFVMGRAWRTGVPLYQAMFDHKPPLIYILAGLFPTMFEFRAALAALMLLHTALFWELAKRLWQKTRPLMAYVSSIIFVFLTTLPTFEGLTVNAELLMMVPVTASILILWGAKREEWSRYLLAGLIGGIGWLFKIPVAMDMAAVGIFFLIFMPKTFWESLRGIFSWSMLAYAIGFVTPLAMTFVYYYFKGSGPSYLETVITVNLGYVSSWSTSSYTFNPFKSGLVVRGTILLVFTLWLYLTRKKLDRSFVLILLWFAFSLFGALLSDRPYPHYLQEPIVPFALLLPYLFVAETIWTWSLIAATITLLGLMQQQIKFGAYPTISVYQTYWQYVAKQISWPIYLDRFNNSTRNYEIADYLNQRLTSRDEIYLWSTDPTVYNLTNRLPTGGKYIVSFHVRDLNKYDYTIDNLLNHVPKYILVDENSGDFPQLMALIGQKYVFARQFGNVEIYIRL
jgi:hypothetical protein